MNLVDLYCNTLKQKLLRYEQVSIECSKFLEKNNNYEWLKNNMYKTTSYDYVTRTTDPFNTIRVTY